MMRKATTVVILMFAFVLCGGIGGAFAQESTPSSKPAAQDNPSPVEAYRLDFSVNEMEDGKKINTRQYAMNLNGNDGNDIKIGTRVPVEITHDQFQYIDVGTSIWSRLQARDGQLRLEVRAEISNFAIPDQAEGHDARPLIRQLKINASTIALLNKPMVVGSVDDPNSKRQFQLEVTVTKLR